MKHAHIFYLIALLAVSIALAEKLALRSARSAGTIAVTSTTDVSDGDTSSIAALIATPGPDGVISLREAITAANNTAGADTINFNIIGGGVKSITPLSALPTITSPVTIEGYTQGVASANTLAVGDNSVHLIELSGGPVGAALIITAGNSTIRGLVINRFTNVSFNAGNGIRLLTNGGNKVEGCFIGISADGATAQSNTDSGVDIESSPNNTIGGTTPAARNVISSNTSPANIVINGAGSSGNTIQGNYIGTNAAGTAAMAGSVIGVQIVGNLAGTGSNIIGGTTAAARNVISGNTSVGVNLVENTITGNVIQGNYIGTNAAGTAAVGNGTGINLVRANNNTFGGTVAGAGNVISGNVGLGIGLADSSSNLIQGNLVGTNAAGTAAVPNVSSVGILLGGGSNNTIGGTTPGARNIISGNGAGGNGHGIRFALDSTTDSGNLIQGNYIGTDINGTAALGNAGSGIQIFAFVQPTGINTIGGTSAAARNIISANGGSGITGSVNNFLIQGNYIGTDVNGTADLGNGNNGIELTANNTTIGGAAAGAGNVIAFNGKNTNTSNGDGVHINPSTGNSIRGNSIFSNTRLGIDLVGGTENAFGVTANDNCDLDDGANRLQNFPVITSAVISGSNVIIEGTLDSNASSTFTLDFYANPACDSSGSGEGKTYIGSAMVTTAAAPNCTADFTGANRITLTPPVPVPSGQRITATATDSSGNTSEFSACSTPTLIQLEDFTATGYDNGVMLEWQTGFEVNNLGFRIYRDSSSGRALLNPEPVAGSALVAGSVALTAGRSYAWWDKEIADCGSPNADCQNAQYWLEDLDLNGESTWHGPYYVRQVGGNPEAKSQGQAALLSSIGRRDADTTRTVEATAELVRTSQSRAQVSSTITARNTSSPASGVSALAVVQQASLTTSHAAKIIVKQAGWYRVTEAELVTAGFDVKADPRMLRLFVDGRELPIIVAGEDDGRFDANDAVEFYGLGLNTASTDTRVYWLVADSQKGLRITDAPITKGYPSGESFAYTVERRDRTIYFSALRNGDEENFFGAVITSGAVDQKLTLNNISQTTRERAVIEVSLQGVTGVAHQVSVMLNGSSIGRVFFNGQAKGQQKIEVPHSMLREGENLITLQSVNGPSDVSLVDAIRVTYQHTYHAENDSLSLTARSGETATISGFSTKDIQVLDVTDERDVQRLAVSIHQTKDGYSATFSAPNAAGIRAFSGERKLLALTNSKAHRASSLKLNESSNWRNSNNAADLVIITPRSFFTALEPLKKARQAEGYKVAVVDVEDVYDEFSFGNKAPSSMRDFLSLARSSWKRAPRFVLLAGDASYDPKNYLGFGENDLAPTKLIDTAYMETASDDWFSDFDGDGVADMSTGRLPVRSVEEAARAVSKVIRYQQTEQSSSALLVSDQNDGFNFEQASSQLRALIPRSFRVEEIRRGQLDPAIAKARLLEAIGRGQKLVNYAGHGSVNQWRGNLLTNEDAGNLTNGERLPVFVMMTCLNGYFHDPGLDSLAESLLKAENGGAVAVWTSTGMTEPGDQSVLNKQLYQLLFTAGNGMTLGEATARAKASVTDGDIRRTWVFLGDPTMRLR